MSFEWDTEKALRNSEKHGVSFEIAVEVFRDPEQYEFVDDRLDYGEPRWNVVGLVDGLELTITYTVREDTIRIISARRVDRYEREKYWNYDLRP